jgi:hypothetical protein
MRYKPRSAAHEIGRRRTIDLEHEQRFDRVVFDKQGRFYVAGSVDHDGVQFTSELFVSAFETSGTHLWTQRFSLTDQNEGSRIAVDDCGDVLLVGNGLGTIAGFLAARVSRDGVVKARLTVPLTGGGVADDVAPAPGGVFVTGASGESHQNGFLSPVAL